jgi:nucleotide-binding universal stress UspA family protein
VGDDASRGAPAAARSEGVGDGRRELYTRLEQRGRDHLARLGHALEAHGVPRREEGIFGHRAPEIVRYAVEVGSDLILLKSHRIDLENPSAGWGTVSYKVGSWPMVACSWSSEPGES